MYVETEERTRFTRENRTIYPNLYEYNTVYNFAKLTSNSSYNLHIRTINLVQSHQEALLPIVHFLVRIDVSNPRNKNAPSMAFRFSEGTRGLSARLHESINKHRRLPVSTTSVGIFPSPLGITAAKVKGESPAERKAFNPWKQRIVVVLHPRSRPVPPLAVLPLSTLRHSIFHYFPIVRSSLAVSSISISLL